MGVLFLVFLALQCKANFLEDTIVSAIKTAHENLHQREKDEVTVDGIAQTQIANVDSQEEQQKGDLLSETTKIVVERFGSSILDKIFVLDVDELLARAGHARKKRNARECGRKEMICNSPLSNQYRSLSGVCNNRANFTWGAAVTATRRLSGKPNYEDGFNAIRSKGAMGNPLPSAREISNKLHQEGAEPAFDFTRNHFYMQFGQWIAHDLIAMPSSVGPHGKSLDCSSCSSANVTVNCAPIPVPEDDPYFKSFNNGTARCIRLTRALNAQQGLGFRTQINQNSHFLDLSQVYGSEECEGASVRSFVNGSLEIFTHNGDVLPPQNKLDTNCQSKDPQFCFTAGDFRNSFHPALISLHVIYIREHNRIAAQLKASNPNWNDQKIYEETRRINIAQYQHHVYNEYLPVVLGEKLVAEFRLKPLAKGFITDYSPSINPSISVEFSAAAFRFGHGLVRKDFTRVNNQNTTVGTTVDLGSNIFYADSLYSTNQGGTASLVQGLVQHAAMKADNKFSFPIRNQLFEIRGQPGSGVDLVAVNIMRGRDVGLAAYNEYRTMAGLKRATFDDLTSEMDVANVEALKKVYEHVDDIDLYTGIMLERPVEGAAIGPTGGFIIAEQFSALKRADRFYYENRVRGTNSLRPGELRAIRRTRLAKLICTNTPGMANVPNDVFKLDTERVLCSSLSELEIRAFATISSGK